MVPSGELGGVESAEHLVDGRPRRTRTKRAQKFSTEWHSVRKLIARIPAPCGDHRENELPTVAEQRLIDARVVLADRLGDMGEIELDGPAAARFEVNEQRSVRGAEHVAKVRVASSNLVVRSEGVSIPIQRWVGREARQRTANPFTRVQIPYPPRTE